MAAPSQDTVALADDPELSKAATKIQAVHRGKHDRKEVEAKKEAQKEQTTLSLMDASAVPAVAKSPRRQKAAKPSALCAWREGQPDWQNMNSVAERSDARYWNDKSYAEFYNMSTEERQTMMASTAGAGLAPLGSAKLAASWRRRGVPAPPTSPRHKKALLVGGAAVLDEQDLGCAGSRPGLLSDRKAARFQQVFAELSCGANTIAPSQVQTLFRNLDVPQPRVTAERLLREGMKASAAEADPAAARAALARDIMQAALEGEDEPADNAIVVATSKPLEKLSYGYALQLYEQVLLPSVAMAAVNDAVDEFTVEALGGTLAVSVNERLGPAAPPPQGFEAQASAMKSLGAPTMPAFTSSQQGRLHALARDEKHAALYRLPSHKSPRNTSIFKKLGKFTVNPRNA